MRKIDSMSMNMNSPANLVATRLNGNVRFNLKGCIDRNDGLIPFAELSILIDYFYFKNNDSKENVNLKILKVVQELTEDFNMLTEYDEKYFCNKYTYKMLLVIMYVFDKYKDKDKSDMCVYIDKGIEIINTMDNKKFYNKNPRKSLMNEIEKILRMVDLNEQSV